MGRAELRRSCVVEIPGYPLLCAVRLGRKEPPSNVVRQNRWRSSQQVAAALCSNIGRQMLPKKADKYLSGRHSAEATSH